MWDSDNCYDVIIVGRGIAGSTLVHYIHEKNPTLKVAVLYSSRNRSCSLHSMGIVSAFGMRPDSSSRGDMICTAVRKAEDFFVSKRPPGVEKVPHFNVQAKPKSHCYVITPDTFLAWLVEHSGCEYWNEHVVEVEESGVSLPRVKTSSGKVFEGKFVVLASGAYIKKDNKLFSSHPFVMGSSIVKGSYGIFKDIDWGEYGFVFSHGKANLIYRPKDKKIIIGGTTDGEGGMEPNLGTLECFHDIFSELFVLPSLNLATFGVGLRHRGEKRMPFWGAMAKGIYGIMGLYKNGWSLSFLAAEKISHQLHEALAKR